jgi:hypothetical protein
MTAHSANRRYCLHPNACRAKGAGHCKTCWGAATWPQVCKRRVAKSKEAVRAKKVPVTLASVRLGASK